jgi:hypothetical protein
VLHCKLKHQFGTDVLIYNDASRAGDKIQSIEHCLASTKPSVQTPVPLFLITMMMMMMMTMAF